MQAITIRGQSVAISPLSTSGSFRLLETGIRAESEQEESTVADNSASVTEINTSDSAIMNARNSSLLYQVVDTLLDAEQSPTSPLESNQIYNRLLTASLVDNEQFIRSLSEPEN